jgi:hypothetical protein
MGIGNSEGGTEGGSTLIVGGVGAAIGGGAFGSMEREEFRPEIAVSM